MKRNNQAKQTNIFYSLLLSVLLVITIISSGCSLALVDTTPDNEEEILQDPPLNDISPQKKAIVIIKHLYDDKDELTTDTIKVQNVNIGESYTALARNEKNYHSDGNKSIVVEEGENIVTINYKRKTAKLIINHVYDDKETVSQTITEKVGARYLVNADIDSCYLSEGDKEITIEEGENIITINYKRKTVPLIINHIYNDKEPLKEIIAAKIETEYTINPNDTVNYLSEGSKKLIIKEGEANTVTINYTRKGLYYYDSLKSAITDANNGSPTNYNPSLNYLTATVQIFNNIDTKETIISPLKNIELTENLVFSGEFTLDINGKEIKFSNTSAPITIEKNANIILADTKESGKLVLDIDDSATDAPYFYRLITVKSQSSFRIKNGAYQIENSSSHKSSAIIYSSGNSIFDTPTFKMNMTSNQTPKASTMIELTSDSSLTINGGTYSAYTTSGITGMYSNNALVTINNANMLVSSSTTTASVYAIQGYVSANRHFIINDGIFEADCPPRVSTVLDSGATILFTIYNSGVFNINGGTFTGIHSALSINGNGTAKINGGSFRGVSHGGIYFSTANTYIKNASLSQHDYSGIYTYDKNNFSNNQASFYIGTSSRDVYVYMDNCIIERGISVLSSSYSYKNTYLYASNTAFNTVRVDGSYSQGGTKGHFYVGKGTTYKRITSAATPYDKGVVDESTYSGTTFVN